MLSRLRKDECLRHVSYHREELQSGPPAALLYVLWPGA